MIESTSGTVSPTTVWARAVLLLGLTVWTWQFAFTPLLDDVMQSFLHLPNLVFHEAGHVIFSPFGRFMTVLGGSVMQLLIPCAAAVAFLRQQQSFGAAICTWWLGQSLVDLAPYIADARSLQLVLLGGRTGAEVDGHDWEFILLRLGLLHRDHALATAAHAVGMIIMAVSLAFGVRSAPGNSE